MKLLKDYQTKIAEVTTASADFKEAEKRFAKKEAQATLF